MVRLSLNLLRSACKPTAAEFSIRLCRIHVEGTCQDVPVQASLRRADCDRGVSRQIHQTQPAALQSAACAPAATLGLPAARLSAFAAAPSSSAALRMQAARQDVLASCRCRYAESHASPGSQLLSNSLMSRSCTMPQGCPLRCSSQTRQMHCGSTALKQYLQYI